MTVVGRKICMGLLGSALLAAAAPAPSTTTSLGTPATGAEAPLELSKITVNGSKLTDYPPIPKAELSGGGLAPSEPPVRIFFPGKAYSEGIPKGYASVAVELDDNGHAVDYLLSAYTEKYFGDALLREAKDTKYSPLLFKGVAVPSRFNFGYEFRQEFTVAISSFTAFRNRLLEVSGGRPDFKYQPVMKEDLDSPLEFIRQAVPNYPGGFTPAVGKPDSVMVSFFVDEEGRVRIPNVDSASSPLLIPNAIKAVHFWQFKPPLKKGKPVLVFAAYAVSFTRASD
jgi:outer membrane biosynthesis protein TonB